MTDDLKLCHSLFLLFELTFFINQNWDDTSIIKKSELEILKNISWIFFKIKKRNRSVDYK